MGMPYLQPHVFRYTWATHAAEDGIAMSVIAEFLRLYNENSRKKLHALVERQPPVSRR
jgi:integrase